jgi:hypothetical protein
MPKVKYIIDHDKKQVFLLADHWDNDASPPPWIKKDLPEYTPVFITEKSNNSISENND